METSEAKGPAAADTAGSGKDSRNTGNNTAAPRTWQRLSSALVDGRSQVDLRALLKLLAE